MVQVVQEIDNQDFWENVLGTEWERWSWWANVKYDYFDYTKGLSVSVFDPDVDEVDWDWRDPSTVRSAHLTVDDIARAYGALKAKFGSKFYDWDNSDADSGDQIVQYAIFGEVIYG